MSCFSFAFIVILFQIKAQDSQMIGLIIHICVFSETQVISNKLLGDLKSMELLPHPKSGVESKGVKSMLSVGKFE